MQVRCPVPRIPLHGEQEVHSLAAGGTVSYSCTHGYRLEGAGLLTCLANKTWSSSLPTCRRIYCPAPATPQHGSVAVGDREYQAQAQYSCLHGYILVGPHTRSCLHTGHWTGPQPTCQPSLCPKVAVKHGLVAGGGLAPGDAVTVKCEPGFRLEGTARLVCQMSLDLVPAVPSCLPVHCSRPQQVEHASSLVKSTAYLGTMEYTCYAGYEVHGTSTMTCSGTGSWSGSPPSCVPRSCGYLETPPHSSLSFHSTSGYDLGYGSSVRVSCLPGYVALQLSSLTCSQDGEWRGEVFPCLPVPCGSPPRPRHGSVVVAAKDGHYHAEFTCSPGYRLVGAASLLCGPDSTWQFSM